MAVLGIHDPTVLTYIHFPK